MLVDSATLNLFVVADQCVAKVEVAVRGSDIAQDELPTAVIADLQIQHTLASRCAVHDEIGLQLEPLPATRTRRAPGDWQKRHTVTA